MVARHSLRFVVSCDDDLTRAEEAIGSAQEPVVIEANSGSGALLEIEEFRCLAAAVNVSGVDVTFASDDPLRRELARIVGLRIEDPQPPVSGVRRALESNAPTRKIEREDIARELDRPVKPAPSLSEALNDYTNHGSDESYASFSFVITPPVPRRIDLRPGDLRPAENRPSARPLRRRRASRKVGKVAAVATISALAIILASTLILVALIAPQATITLAPTSSVVNADIRYGVAGQGGSYDVTVDPEPIATTITFSATIPTTGVRTEPDGIATGEILLTNPMTSEVFLPAGSELAGPDGISFSTTDDVTVPAADPFGTLTMGSAVTGIVAGVAGPDGNLDAHVLSGQLSSGLFFSNRDATSGGTLKEIATVAETDLEALRTQAEAGLSQRSGNEIAAQVPTGHQMVAGSVEVATASYSFSHEAGTDATEVSIDAAQNLSALVYDPDALHQLARDELNQRLTDALPRDSVLLAESIDVGSPQEIPTASGNPEYRMTASARSRAVLDQEVLNALKKDLVGVPESDAGLRVAMLKGVARFDIEYGPTWFPFDWPPRLESRIAINIDDRTATETATGEAGP